MAKANVFGPRCPPGVRIMARNLRNRKAQTRPSNIRGLIWRRKKFMNLTQLLLYVISIFYITRFAEFSLDEKIMNYNLFYLLLYCLYIVSRVLSLRFSSG